jgi:hypothetical protein
MNYDSVKLLADSDSKRSLRGEQRRPLRSVLGAKLRLTFLQLLLRESESQQAKQGPSLSSAAGPQHDEKE